MKKKMLGVIAVVAIAVVAGWNSQQDAQKVNLSDVALDNIEAVARYIDPHCPNGCIEGKGGCYCYKDYPDFEEAKHP